MVELLGLYGGTFDPVHLGHIHAARSVCRALGLSKVQLILAARPGHRGAPDSSVEHRWRMLQLACAAYEELVADDSEIRRHGRSYTVSTLTHVHERFPGSIPCWILGQDSFATLPSWHRWQELLSLCNLIVVDRPGLQLQEPEAVRALCALHETQAFRPDVLGQIVRLDLPMQDISATQIRGIISRGGDPAHLLAAPVNAYIKRHGLYTSTEDPV